MRPLKIDDVPVFVKWEKERPYPWTEQNFLETISSPSTRTFVWDNHGAVAGFAVVQVIGAEAYLQNIFVNSAFRRQGLGETIFKNVADWAKRQGASELFLDVEETNEPAKGLYKKMHMTILDRRKKSYPRGEDALIMRGLL